MSKSVRNWIFGQNLESQSSKDTSSVTSEQDQPKKIYNIFNYQFSEAETVKDSENEEIIEEKRKYRELVVLANNGNDEAEYKLGIIFRDGNNFVDKDLEMAKRAFENSSVLGNKDARTALTELLEEEKAVKPSGSVSSQNASQLESSESKFVSK